MLPRALTIRYFSYWTSLFVGPRAGPWHLEFGPLHFFPVCIIDWVWAWDPLGHLWCLWYSRNFSHGGEARDWGIF